MLAGQKGLGASTAERKMKLTTFNSCLKIDVHCICDSHNFIFFLCVLLSDIYHIASYIVFQN